MERIIENNQVTISGTIAQEFEFDREIFGEGFYKSYINTERLSGVCDTIPIIVSERLIAVHDEWMGQVVKVRGQFRSYNKRDSDKNRLVLYVFVREMEILDSEAFKADDVNKIMLEGYICKQPNYRETPQGRELADMLIAVNRLYGKSDYIPCIVWGRNAAFASGLEVGTYVKISGRIQSREYTKRIDEETEEKRVCYEVSVSKIECVAESEKEGV